MKKQNWSILLTITAIITGFGLQFSNTSQAGVSGTYPGAKLPWPSGVEKYVTGDSRTHDINDNPLNTVRHALDLRFGIGENVLAIKPGTVAYSGFDNGGGNLIIIDHGDTYCSVYAHLSSRQVYEGQSVTQGQFIGLSGNTSTSTTTVAPHLHMSVFKKVSTKCLTADRTQEIAIHFNEIPETAPKVKRELVRGDTVISQNTMSPITSNRFTSSVVSSPTITTSAVNYTVTDTNLNGKYVYWQMWRGSVNGDGGMTWGGYGKATSNSITFSNLDSAGDTFAGVDYYLVTSLNPIVAGEAAKRRTSCGTATGRLQLCDVKRR